LIRIIRELHANMVIKNNISFLQSNEWAEFQKSLSRMVWRVNGISIVKHNLPFKKSYLYSPRLCFSSFGGQTRFKILLNKIREIAKKENAIFFKAESQKQIDENLLKKFGFRKGQNIQPDKTLILNITRPEKELLKEMHSKTRYNIRLAEKKRVEIRIDNNKFESFWKLLEQTAKRDRFHAHPKEYYKKMLEIPGVELFVAGYKNKIIAANIVVFYKKRAIYLHGASDYQYRNLMATYLLQWQQILEAKKRGCTEYDFCCIVEKKWPGLTRFKKGFNGKEVNYPGAYDLVFQPAWYRAYKIARKIL